MRFYLLGIKGSGMAALAGILQDDGNFVQGADIDHKVFTTRELDRRSIIYENIDELKEIPAGYDFVVVGHAFINHRLVKDLEKKKIPWKEYHLFLHDYFSSLYQVAICGTHGKTTTTGYFYQALKEVIPSSMLRGDGIGIGGFSHNLIVYEACEYQDHFLVYEPNTIVITNIDYDHVDYFKTKRQYNSAFNKFAKKARLVICNYLDCHKVHHHNLVTFGLEEEADYHFKNLTLDKGIKGEIYFHNEKIFDLNLPIYGTFNALHLLSVVAFLHQNNLDIEKAFKKFYEISGINRRMQHKIIARDVFIDDYAHHPNEILASLNNVRLMYPSHRVVGIFKPDRYSRLVKFQREFRTVLKNFDQAYVLPLYEETKDETKLLALNTRISYVDTLAQLCEEEKDQKNTVYLFMSSKNVDDWIYGLAKFKV